MFRLYMKYNHNDNMKTIDLCCDHALLTGTLTKSGLPLITTL